MKRKTLMIFVSLVGLTLGLAACSQAADPGDVVEQYFAALVATDDVQAVNLSCVEWEQNAKAEGASFEGVEVALEDPDCSLVEEDGDTGTVTCTGKIVFSYAGGENEEIGLDIRSYIVALEGGEWKMCGYK